MVDDSNSVKASKAPTSTSGIITEYAIELISSKRGHTNLGLAAWMSMSISRLWTVTIRPVAADEFFNT